MTVEINGQEQAQDRDNNSNTRLNFSLRTIVFSHFNEKARWALDYYCIPYTEYRSLPLCHIISMFRHRTSASPGATNTRFMTPFLSATAESTDDRQQNDLSRVENSIALSDSTKIAEFLSEQYAAAPNSKQDDRSPPPNLYSNDAGTKSKILALEDRFGTMIGPHVRRFIYYEVLLHSPKSVGRSLGQNDNVGPLQSWIWTFFFSLISFLLVKALRVNENSAARSKDILKREFEHISRVLESGPPGPAYLIGNQFTAADLTLASLGALIVGVGREEGYGAWVPRLEQLRPEARAFCEELRQTTAGQHILECYKLHRGEKAPGSSYGYMFFGLW